ncbi:MAG: XRE family transcriptional regulator [Symploca sp. SIO2G7]|nr:XRE family transcriptional regulator [Symploca sp. SIO2G7]
MRTKPFSELRKRMTPERREQNETRTKLASLLLTLKELQNSSELTQDNLEKNLSIIESTLSELESQEDISVSTLSRYIKALGGSLKIVANFSGEEIVLAQFD